MRSGSLEPYEASLRDRHELTMVADDGTVIPLDVQRYLREVDAADLTVLERCTGPTLDLGAGPGRMVRALATRGVVCLGVDLAAAAVKHSNGQGATALQRDVFARLPGEGRWQHALLVDGNIGIGGGVDRLLTRVASLLAPRGQLLVETAGDEELDVVHHARFARHGVASGPFFAWAQIGACALVRRSAAAGMTPTERWTAGDRHFLALTR